MRQPVLRRTQLSILGLILLSFTLNIDARFKPRTESPRSESAEQVATPQEHQAEESDHPPALPSDSHARVCDNRELSKVFDIISRACTRHECDINKLGELDREIDRAELLGTLRNPDLSAIHLFFPVNKDSVGEIFDWYTQKRSQLDSIKFSVSRPQETVVFVLGKASRTGSIDHNRELSRDRARSVIRYIQTNIDLPFHHIHGAWAGREFLQFSNSDSRSLNLEPQDYRRDDLVLNQAVHVFIYPCAKPMNVENDH